MQMEQEKAALKAKQEEFKMMLEARKGEMDIAMKQMDMQLKEVVAGLLTCSGFVTSITILLIVVFLFIEAFSLFKSKVIEDGYVLALNKANPVNRLSPSEIKNIFDEEITNWKEVGGIDAPIKVFRLENITEYYSEEELGEAYELAGDKIAELVQHNLS